MQREPFPWKKYIYLPFGLLAPAGWFFCQQWLQTSPRWAGMPWLEMTAGVVLFGLGNLYADLLNSGSQLRKWWSDRRRIFTAQFHPSSTAVPDANVPRFVLTFISHSDGIALELMLYEHIQFSINKPPVLLKRIDPKSYSEGEQVKVPIATIHRSGIAGDFWGDAPTRNGPIGGTGNLVEIRAVKNGKVKQRYAVFISYREFEHETANKYFYLTEDRHVFER